MKLLRCDCGFETSAEEDEELVDRAQSHALQAHGVALRPQMVPGLISRAERARFTPPTATGASGSP